MFGKRLSLLVPTLRVGMPSLTLRVASLIEPSSTNNLMGRTRYRFGEHSFPHVLTSTVVGWLPDFTRPDTSGRKEASRKRSIQCVRRGSVEDGIPTRERGNEVARPWVIRRGRPWGCRVPRGG
jgi:hypothetical protein